MKYSRMMKMSIFTLLLTMISNSCLAPMEGRGAGEGVEGARMEEEQRRAAEQGGSSAEAVGHEAHRDAAIEAAKMQKTMIRRIETGNTQGLSEWVQSLVYKFKSIFGYTGLNPVFERAEAMMNTQRLPTKETRRHVRLAEAIVMKPGLWTRIMDNPIPKQQYPDAFLKKVATAYFIITGEVLPGGRDVLPAQGLSLTDLLNAGMPDTEKALNFVLASQGGSSADGILYSLEGIERFRLLKVLDLTGNKSVKVLPEALGRMNLGRVDLRGSAAETKRMNSNVLRVLEDKGILLMTPGMERKMFSGKEPRGTFPPPPQ